MSKTHLNLDFYKSYISETDIKGTPIHWEITDALGYLKFDLYKQENGYVLSTIYKNKIWMQLIEYIKNFDSKYINTNISFKKLYYHRDIHPARISVNLAIQKLTCLQWFDNNQAHRINGPQEVVFQNDIIISEAYKINNKLHRENAPAFIHYSFDPPGRIEREVWHNNGQIHREDGPADICYLTSPPRETQHYFKNNKLHRLDGPAVIRNKIFVSQNEETWFVNGKTIDKTKFPIIKDNKIINNIIPDKSLILDLYLFDRDYGKYIVDFCRANGINV